MRVPSGEKATCKNRSRPLCSTVVSSAAELLQIRITPFKLAEAKLSRTDEKLSDDMFGWPAIVAMGIEFDGCQILIVLSPPAETRVLPSGESAIEATPFEWAFHRDSCRPSGHDQSRIVPSWPPE